MFCINCKANKLKKSGGAGYVEKQMKDVLPKTVVTAENYTTDFGVNGCFMLPEFVMEEGKRYKAVVDGTASEFSTPHIIGDDVVFLAGNAALIGDFGGYQYDDNGEPWLVANYAGMGVYAISFAAPAENEKAHTVAIYEEAETVHPIDPKFLPKVILDMSAFGLPRDALFSSEEIPVDDDVLGVARAAEAMLEPFYLKFTESDGVMTIRMELLFSDITNECALFRGFADLWQYHLIVDYKNRTIKGDSYRIVE